MWDESEAAAARRERMSALLDGELDREGVLPACGHWRDHAEARAAWHAYHLIGDVLRSDDLACDPARDARFLAGLRARLAREPVVLAPLAAPADPIPAVAASPRRAAGDTAPAMAARLAPVPRRGRWLTPAAVAAGFVAVAGVLTLTRPGFMADRPGLAGTTARTSATPAAPQALLAGAEGASPAATRGAAGPAPGAAASPPETFVADGALIRDARLDRYLAAHQQFSGSSALGVPSAFLRNATAEVPGR